MEPGDPPLSCIFSFAARPEDPGGLGCDEGFPKLGIGGAPEIGAEEEDVLSSTGADLSFVSVFLSLAPFVISPRRAPFKMNKRNILQECSRANSHDLLLHLLAVLQVCYRHQVPLLAAVGVEEAQSLQSLASEVVGVGEEEAFWTTEGTDNVAEGFCPEGKAGREKEAAASTRGVHCLSRLLCLE